MITTSPQEATILEFEQRKSAVFGVWFEDERGAPISLVGGYARITVNRVAKSGTTQFVQLDAATMDTATGYVTFAFQASDLDLPAGVYDFVITLVVNGYSLVSVKGELKLLPNPEQLAVTESYSVPPPSDSLVVKLLSNQQIRVALRAYPPDLVQLPADGVVPGPPGKKEIGRAHV